MKSVWINIKQGDDEAENARKVLAGELAKHNVQVIENLGDGAFDLNICLSGDGTLLSTVRRMGDERYKVPVVGVHASNGVGFLHPIAVPKKENEIASWAKLIVDSLVENNVCTFRRFGLDCKVTSADGSVKEFWALNDIVVSKGALSRMIRFSLSIDNTPIYNHIRGDGMIISSATGSTAYSMSAGGPIVHPSLKALVVTPVCLYQLGHRPLVLEPSAKIELQVEDTNPACYLTADGQEGMELNKNDIVSFTQAKDAVTFMLPNVDNVCVLHNFYTVLTDKLGFGLEKKT